jgi:hypothetical protein
MVGNDDVCGFRCRLFGDDDDDDDVGDAGERSSSVNTGFLLFVKLRGGDDGEYSLAVSVIN